MDRKPTVADQQLIDAAKVFANARMICLLNLSDRWVIVYEDSRQGISGRIEEFTFDKLVEKWLGILREANK